MRRVVVTGMGMVSPLGNTVSSSWTALLQGKSGIKTYVEDPILKNKQPFNLALVKQFEFNKWKVPHASNRANSFLWSAADQALQNANLNPAEHDLTKIGICIGSMSSNSTKLLEQIQESRNEDYRTVNRLSMFQILTNIPAATLNVKYKLRGPQLTVSTACASGLSAIVEAFKWIRLGEADVAIAGGTEDVYNPLYLNSSLRLQAMSSKVYASASMSSRPFDKDRSGFILGEGSGIVILESQEHAKKRNARVLAEICGYGYTSDGYHLVRPQENGFGQIRSMQNALNMANLSLSQLSLISTHATSTPAGDQIEANSIKSLLQNTHSESLEKSPSISATKSSIGHTFASAGAIQSIFAIKSIEQSVVPAILNLENPDVDGLNYAKENVKRDIKTVLKNSFGFGGINVSAVFKQYDH